MAISYLSGVFTVTGANVDADLKTALDANPANGTYEEGAAIFKGASLTFAAGASLQIYVGTVLVFDDAAGYRINLPAGTTLDFRFGGGIVYNGNVQNAFFAGTLNGHNIVYTANVNAGTIPRADFFTSTTTSGINGMDNLNIVFGKGVSGGSIYCDLTGLVNKLTNLKFINNIRVAGMTRVDLYFGNGTYTTVKFPNYTSNYVITTPINFYPAYNGGTTTLRNPIFSSSSIPINGITNGFADFINESWTDVATGSVGTLTAGSTNTGNTIISRKISWFPGTFFTPFAWNVRLTDTQASPIAYVNGLVANNNEVLLTWQTYNRNPSSFTNFTPFNITARKRGYVEIVKTFTSYTAVTESFIPVVDSYYTNDQSALANISANATTKVLSTTSLFNATIDQINDWFDWWLEQSAQLASVSTTPKSNNGTRMTMTGWSLINAGTINLGAKLNAMTFSAITNTGTLNCSYTDSTGNYVLTPLTTDVLTVKKFLAFK